MGSINNAINSEQVPFVGFSAHLIAPITQAMGNNQPIRLVFDQCPLNPQADYSPISGIYTCPFEGLYYVGCTLTFKVVSNFLVNNTFVAVYINGYLPGGEADNMMAMMPICNPLNLYAADSVCLKAGNQLYYPANTEINFYANCSGGGSNNITILNTLTGFDIATRYFIYYIGLVP